MRAPAAGQLPPHRRLQALVVAQELEAEQCGACQSLVGPSWERAAGPSMSALDV
jgi:hypothetical protein